MKIDFMKISYDRILTSNQKEYCAKHPEVDMHQAIDIIRDKADQDYLDAIASHCNSSVSNENAANTVQGEPVLAKQLIYLDRNNTPDVWSDIQKTIEKANKESKKQSIKPYKTILILPE